MVSAGKLLFRVPGSTVWHDSLDEIHLPPQAEVEIKELNTIRGPWKRPCGKKMRMQVGLARIKYA